MVNREAVEHDDPPTFPFPSKEIINRNCSFPATLLGDTQERWLIEKRSNVTTLQLFLSPQKKS